MSRVFVFSAASINDGHRQPCVAKLLVCARRIDYSASLAAEFPCFGVPESYRPNCALRSRSINLAAVAPRFSTALVGISPLTAS